MLKERAYFARLLRQGNRIELVKLNLIFVDNCGEILDDTRLCVRRLDAALVESLGGREGKRLFS